nr:IS630 family transposase [Larkinella soli]
MNGQYLARMEAILDLYEQPYDEQYPVVCFDERPCVLHSEAVAPLPMKANQPLREDSWYVRNGTACLLAAFEPLQGYRLIEVTTNRTKADYCRFMQQLAERYPKAKKIRLVQDNLNTHSTSSFYEHLPAPEARQLAQRFDIYYTPKKASWLNMIELEFSVLVRQCLQRRIADIETLRAEINQLVKERNQARATVQWQFTNAHAREKLKRHYQDVYEKN